MYVLTKDIRTPEHLQLVLKTFTDKIKRTNHKGRAKFKFEDLQLDKKFFGLVSRDRCKRMWHGNVWTIMYNVIQFDNPKDLHSNMRRRDKSLVGGRISLKALVNKKILTTRIQIDKLQEEIIYLAQFKV